MKKIRLQLFFHNGDFYKDMLFLPETIGLKGSDWELEEAIKAMEKWIERFPILIQLPDGSNALYEIDIIYQLSWDIRD